MQDAVRWYCGHHRFDLRLPDPSLRERAAQVLGRWASSGMTPIAFHQWRIEHSRDPVQVLGVGMAPLEHMLRRLGHTGEISPRPSEPVVDPQAVSRTGVLSRYLLDAGERAEKAGWVVRNLDNGAVEAVGEEPAQALRAVEYEAVRRVTIDSGEQIAMHSAVVSRNGHGVLIAGPSQAGKSTLSSALWCSGWSYMCDDHALVDVGTAVARPSCRRVSLRAPSRALLGDEFWRRIGNTPSCDETADKARIFHPEEVDGRSRPQRVELAALVFLGKEAAARSAGCRKLEPAHALFEVLGCSNVLLRYGLGAAIERVRPLVEKVPAYELDRRPLDEMGRYIEELA